MIIKELMQSIQIFDEYIIKNISCLRLAVNILDDTFLKYFWTLYVSTMNNVKYICIIKKGIGKNN